MTKHSDKMASWRRLQHASEGDPELDALDQLEADILRQHPGTFAEALGLIEVIRVSLLSGGRCDGLDAEALEGLGRWLVTLSPQAVPTG